MLEVYNVCHHRVKKKLHFRRLTRKREAGVVKRFYSGERF